jgi:hypothetical protein
MGRHDNMHCRFDIFYKLGCTSGESVFAAQMFDGTN